METGSITREKITITVSQEEMRAILNSINEALAAVEGWESVARVGVTRERLLELHAQLAEPFEKSLRM